MKKLLFILITLVSFNTYAQVDSVAESVITTENITEAERIIDKYSSKVVDVFNSAVESATPLAEEGFKMVVRLQIAKGFGNLLSSLFFIVLLITFRKIKIYDYIINDKSWSTPAPLLVVLFIIISFVWAILDLYQAIQYFIAPEWFAIKEILNLI